MTNDLVASRVQLPALLGSGPKDIDDPVRELRFGIVIAVAFFVIFLGWAAFAPLDAAAVAPGRLAVSGQRQSVQHRDGGIIAALKVHEGQKVKAGDVLIELAGQEVRAQEEALGSQMLNLLAQRRRLEAEQVGSFSVTWPASFGDLDVSPEEVKAAIAVQEKELAARRELLYAQSHVLSQQAAAEGESASGYGSQMTSSAEQERLIEEELKSLEPVAEKGFVSKSRIRALERAKADLAGQRGQFKANVAQAHLGAGTMRLKELEAQKTFRERAASELKEVSYSLDELTPKYLAARDQVRRLQVRAPVSGSVVGLSVFTVGGVIAAGQKLMDIVPDRAALVVEARVSPDDVDDVTVGQKAEVKFTGMHDRGLPILSATMTKLSADVLTDEKSGTSFYTAELTVPESELRKIREVRGQSFRLRAGAPVQIVLPVRKRTALQYAFEPLIEGLRKTGTEH